MEPKSHKHRNIVILIVIIVIIILLLARKKDLGLNIGSDRLSDEEKAALIQQLSQQADSGPVLTDSQKEAVKKQIQAGEAPAVELSEEQKTQIIEEAGRNN